jgi:hypothetical protein
MSTQERKATDTDQVSMALSTDRSNHETVSASILTDETPNLKEFGDVQARFALRGFQMFETIAHDGVVLWSANRWGETHIFTRWRGLRAFLSQIGG